MTKIQDRSSAASNLIVEEGSALKRLHGLPASRPVGAAAERLDVIVIGAGQAGLSVGYHLKQRGLRFVILNADGRIGDTWRKRWDSLRLFSPAALDGLDGLPFPAARDYFPTKDEMADYLESYAKHFDLPVRNGVRVERVSKRDGRYVVQAGALELEADHVVVAMASYQKPKVPEFASQLDPNIVQMHSTAYRNAAQLKSGAVLIAGAGNSGAEIATELARAGHKIHMSGRDTGFVPFRIGTWLGSNVLEPMLMRIVFHRILTTSTPMGRKARPVITSKGGPLIRTRPQELQAAGVERTGRVAGVQDGKPVLEDGTVLDVTNVIWCTGFHPGYAFLDLPVFGEDGAPRHQRGVAEGEDGVYFVGLAFLYAMSSAMVHGVGRDAEHVVKAIAGRVGAAAKEKQKQSA